VSFLSKGVKYAREGTVKDRTTADGVRRPRLETKPSQAVTGSYGPKAREWLKAAHGLVLRGWQAYAIDRALEHDADGGLVWRTVVLSVARQAGKSTLARGLTLWRLAQGPDLFGGPQLVLGVSLTVDRAWEVMRPAAAWCVEEYGKNAVRYGNARPGIVLPNGSRWVPMAARAGAGVGYSTSGMLFVDEAWGIPQRIVDDDLAPTMSEFPQAQAWLVSTAGDSDSLLMSQYRNRAIERLETDDPGSLLLLEWSAPPDADPNSVDTWRWASPEWTPARERFIRDQQSQIAPERFATQYLNMWVAKMDHWASDANMARTLEPDRPLPPDAVWSVAVESDFDGMSHAVAVAAMDGDGRMPVRVTMHRTIADVDAHIDTLRAAHPPIHLSITPSYLGKSRQKYDDVVGTKQAMVGTQTLLDLFDRGVIAHDGSPMLMDNLYRSRVSKRQGGHFLVSRDESSVHAVRALMFAAWRASMVPKPAPTIHVRRRG
jgi:hypothetical protein